MRECMGISVAVPYHTTQDVSLCLGRRIASKISQGASCEAMTSPVWGGDNILHKKKHQNGYNVCTLKVYVDIRNHGDTLTYLIITFGLKYTYYVETT